MKLTMEYLSTTSLAAALDTRANELFSKLESLHWIERKNEMWILTDLGKENGGETRTDSKFGEYIVWPENISIETEKEKIRLIDLPTIARHFDVSSQRLNLIISELGWIEKDQAGWTLTKPGKAIGGKVFDSEPIGESNLMWPESLLENKSLKDVFSTQTPNPSKKDDATKKEKNKNAVIKHTEPMYRTLDGHYVRSKAEIIIDDILYHYGVLHAYERKIIVGEEELLSDFYLPFGKVYIEFWGKEGEDKNPVARSAKIEFYKKHDIPVIELSDNDILNLDEYLPRKLLKYGIKVY